MRGVRPGMSGPLAKGQLEHNQQLIQDDQKKRARDRISGEGQGLSDEDESRINEDESRINNDVNDRSTELVEAQPALHNLQQQPQGPQVPPGQIVRWERFLPVRSLKVLLVENDDSTRHVVGALLRNCSYEVTAVANGLEAWKILEDLTNHTDLVLTEVDMPSLSGISLLSMITNHKTRSNTPVIMMSSNDSMGIVFKCLSKGAADFLVKPIRKNELKNLWQHVWRKCHSSSGSGSESGIRTQKSTKSKSVEDSENNTDSNDEDDNGSIGLNCGDGSDNGSGIQSSWSKRAVEIDSPQPMSAWDELADAPDSTCAQFIHSRPEVLHDNQAPTPARREYQKLNDEHENIGMCKDLKQGAARHLDLKLQSPSQKVTDRTRSNQKDKPFDLESDRERKNLERGKVDLNDEAPQNDFLDNDTGPGIATTDTHTMTPEIGSMGNEVANHPSKISKARNMAAYDSKKVPSLELSLKQLRDVSDTGTSTKEHNMLRHSGLSAFSRYNNSKASNPAPTGNMGSCSPIDNSAEAAKTESMRNLISNSSSTPNAGSNESSNNIDMGSTTNNDSIKPEALADRSMPKSTVNIHHGSAFKPEQHGHISSVQPVTASQPSAMNQNIQVQHHHHHYHHHHHHVHNLQQQQQQQQQLNHGGLSSMNIVVTATHFAPSDMYAMCVEGNAADYGSASGSNNGSGQNGSSGQHGSSTGLIAEGTNMTSDNGEAANCGAGGGIGSGSRSGVDQNRLAQREAALHKFRQKRKERNFDKKVRYQSRKRLAEQRPRIRGQFVRQATDENRRNDKSDDADS